MDKCCKYTAGKINISKIACSTISSIHDSETFKVNSTLFNPKLEYSGYWLLLMNKDVEWYLGRADRKLKKILFLFVKLGGWIGFPLLFNLHML